MAKLGRKMPNLHVKEKNKVSLTSQSDKNTKYANIVL